MITGNPGCSSACESNKNEKDILDSEITALKVKMAKAVVIVDLQEEKDKANAEDKPVIGYLSRVAALESLGKKSLHVRIASIFVMLAFICLDVLLVIFKGTTNIGAYEHKKDTLLIAFKTLQDSEKRNIRDYAENIYKAPYTTKLEADAKLQEVTCITESLNKLVIDQEKQYKSFEEHTRIFHDRMNNVETEAEKNEIYSQLLELKELHKAVNTVAINKLREFVHKDSSGI